MARIDLSRFGTKHTCYSCACKFYDMNRGEVLCPKCGANQKEAPHVDVAAMEALAIKPSRAPKAPRPQRTILDDSEEEIESEDDAPISEDDDFEFDDDLDFGDEPEIDDDDDEEEVP